MGERGTTKDRTDRDSHLNSIILNSLARNWGSNWIASGSSRFQSNKNQIREQRELMGSILKPQLRYNFLRVFRITIACRRQEVHRLRRLGLSCS